MVILLTQGCCWRGSFLCYQPVHIGHWTLWSVAKDKKSQRVNPCEICCCSVGACSNGQLRNDILFSMGIALGSTAGVGRDYAVWQQGTGNSFRVSEGRALTAAGSDRKVYLQSSTYMLVPTGRTCWLCAEGEGWTSWGWQQQPCSISVFGSLRRDPAFREAVSVLYSY